MKRWRQWRSAVHLRRRMLMALEVRRSIEASFRAGLLEAHKAGREAPPEPGGAPVFDCCAPRRVRRRQAREVNEHSMRVGLYAGWQAGRAATASLAQLGEGVQPIETTAETMIREAEDFANRGHQ